MFRSEEVGWEMVGRFFGRRSKGRGIGVSRYTKEEKYGEISIQNIQYISEKNIGE